MESEILFRYSIRSTNFCNRRFCWNQISARTIMSRHSTVYVYLNHGFRCSIKHYATFFWLNSYILNKLKLKFQWWWLTVRLTRLFMKMSRSSSMSKILNMLSWFCSSLWDWNFASSVETVGTKSIVVIQFEVCDRICLKWVLFIFEETKQIIIFQI